MSVRWLRWSFACFLLLTAAFTINLMLLQPLTGHGKTLALKAQAGTGSGNADVATGAIVILNASTRKPAADTSKAESPEMVRAMQRELQARGYETGSPDGMPGLVTRASIMAFEADHGLPLTALASEALLQKVLLGAPPRRPGAAPVVASPEAEQVIRTVQQSLANLGYAPGSTDGRLGDQTLRAVREFEADQGLAQTGRISGQLVGRLARLAGQGRIADGR